MDLTEMDDVNWGNLYDEGDDLIDYPLDNESSNGGLVSGDGFKAFPSIWDGALQDASEPLLLGTIDNLASDLPAEFSVPNEDIVQLEWLSTFMDDSFLGGGMPVKMDIMKKSPLGPVDIKQKYNGTQAVKKCLHCAITKTPLWRNGPMGPKTLCNACGVRYRAGRLFPEYRPSASPTFNPCLHSNSYRKVTEMRKKPVEKKSIDVFSQHIWAKRPRSATFSPCTSVQLTTNNVTVPSGSCSESESDGESENGNKCDNPQAMEEKMIAPQIPLGPMDIKQNNNVTQAIRRCQQCEKTKTPQQWRNGPMGPKSACSACGVCYKSGSPTLVPPRHSNSLKKVREIRNKLVEEKCIDVTQHARTKRQRCATFCPCMSDHENHVIDLSPVSSESEGVGETENGNKYQKAQAMEEKMKNPLGTMEIKQNNRPEAVRRCHHCGITKTPQWRNGPLGTMEPTSLCNACGIRYNSGRSLPEDRPAASPPFVPYLRSNSHRKVIRMRNNSDEETFVDIV